MYYSYDAQNKWVDASSDIFKIGINKHRQDVFKVIIKIIIKPNVSVETEIKVLTASQVCVQNV